jgi:hypothetical protein
LPLLKSGQITLISTWLIIAQERFGVNGTLKKNLDAVLAPLDTALLIA